jgi:hypothetical protein
MQSAGELKQLQKEKEKLKLQVEELQKEKQAWEIERAERRVRDFYQKRDYKYLLKCHNERKARDQMELEEARKLQGAGKSGREREKRRESFPIE